MHNNFIVDNPSKALREEVMAQAEFHRRHVAKKWLGRELPTWSFPCLLFISIGDIVHGQFFHHGRDIRGVCITGPYREVVDRTLPHEIAHTVLRTEFGDDLPLWIDEGIAVSAESDAPNRLGGLCGTQPLHKLFDVVKYPDDWRPFYGQSYSVVRYMTEKYGVDNFMNFVKYGRGIKGVTDWDESAFLYLGTNLDRLNDDWKRWHSKTFESASRNTGLSLRKYGPYRRRWNPMEAGDNSNPQRIGRRLYESVRKALRGGD